jgi:hypothetical protein
MGLRGRLDRANVALLANCALFRLLLVGSGPYSNYNIIFELSTLHTLKVV